MLIALIDPTHVGHEAAHKWFAERGANHGRPVLSRRTASCASPVTRDTPIQPAPAAVAPIVARLRALAGHIFWKDDLSLVDFDLVDVDQIATPGQVTDTYLLALAVANEGQLATFDRRLSPKICPSRKERASPD